MTTRYETAFIIQPTLTEEEIKQKVEFIKETLENLEAQIKAIYHMGMRELAYRIKKYERGYYVVIYFVAKPSVIKELERVYRITEDIIRFMTIKYTRKVEIKAWEKMIQKALGNTESSSQEQKEESKSE